MMRRILTTPTRTLWVGVSRGTYPGVPRRGLTASTIGHKTWVHLRIGGLSFHVHHRYRYYRP